MTTTKFLIGYELEPVDKIRSWWSGLEEGDLLAVRAPLAKWMPWNATETHRCLFNDVAAAVGGNAPIVSVIIRYGGVDGIEMTVRKQ